MRLWQTAFQVVQAIENLPVPCEIVFEKQTSPSYQIQDCRRKADLYAQIVCTLQGEGWFMKDGKIHQLTPGKAFMHVLGTPDISYGYPLYNTEPWSFIWFSFSGPAVIPAVKEMIQRYGYVFDLPLDTGFVKHLQGYYPMRDTLQMLSPTAGAKIVFDALGALGETLEADLTSSHQAILVRDVQHLIRNNLDRTLDIALIAEKLHVSREHLTRVFHSQTGQSPGQYALEMRMKTASRLLQDNALSCKEIAERLGYESASSFARVFRSFFSVSPTQFRENPMENSISSAFTRKHPESCSDMLSAAESVSYCCGSNRKKSSGESDMALCEVRYSK